VTTTDMPKAARCETLRQAERWDIRKNEAVRFGLCDPCAAQYAWGLQDGFSTVRPPCPDCSQLVGNSIGAVKPSGWRVLPRTPGHPDNRKRLGGPQTRLSDPAKGIDGWGVCARCRSTWTGFSAAHCDGCHQTFTGREAFDAHRVGTHAKRRCADPAVVGLVKIRRPHWTGWGHPAGHNGWAATAADN
jgi:hypothetical protein